MSIEKFHRQGQRNLLIAAAGHGKTYTISELARINDHPLPYLILTHTHAGVASLREKMMSRNISSSNYVLTTIHAFCQSLVLAYVHDYSTIPSRENNPSEFYKYLCTKAIELIRLKVVSATIKSSYSGVIVDEYQDCNVDQHNFALELARIIPLRALGDPLQCIFDFKDKCVDFNTDFNDFELFKFLDKPWRWINSGNDLLGKKILKCRDHLEKRVENDFRLVDDQQSNFRILTNFDINSPQYLQEIGRFIRGIVSESLLVIIPSRIKYKGQKGIVPTFCTIQHRADIRSRMGLTHGFSLLESIDDKDFYGISKTLDDFFKKKHASVESYVKEICDLLTMMTLGVTNINEYINRNNGKFIKKKDLEKSKISSYLTALFNRAYSSRSRQDFTKIARFFHYNLKTPIKRPELYFDLLSSIDASSENKSILDCMIERRNMLRRQGRKVKGKAIGTTLLTKGLEFDTVVVFQADMIEDRRNFYVAISRASKNLYLITSSEKITLIR